MENELKEAPPTRIVKTDYGEWTPVQVNTNPEVFRVNERGEQRYDDLLVQFPRNILRIEIFRDEELNPSNILMNTLSCYEEQTKRKLNKNLPVTLYLLLGNIQKHEDDQGELGNYRLKIRLDGDEYNVTMNVLGEASDESFQPFVANATCIMDVHDNSGDLSRDGQDIPLSALQNMELMLSRS
jgi:hypothetical protein